MSIALTKTEQEALFKELRARAEAKGLYAVKYLDLGVSVLRVLCYAQEVLQLLEKQFTYVLRDDSNHYEGTIVVWKDEQIEEFLHQFCKQLPLAKRMRIRVEMLCMKMPSLCFESSETNVNLGCVNTEGEHIEIFDSNDNIAYFGQFSFEPEVFNKQGHAFVRVVNRLIEKASVNVMHGAVFGYDGSGFLLCGRGMRGKSTLTIESMLQGFEYVADDYQILEKRQDGLFAYPIYSIVSLSYRMYNEMYDRFLGKFVCNNFNQNKYIFNISQYHSQFRTIYPIKFCLFPEIVADAHPSIVPCTSEEKGRAIVQLVHSTLQQIGELGDNGTTKKLVSMVKDSTFLKFNLCNNIPENTRFLKTYLKKLETKKHDIVPTPGLLLDITYGLGVILDTNSWSFVSMNKLATAIFVCIQKGTDTGKLRAFLQKYSDHNPAIIDKYDKFLTLQAERGYVNISVEDYVLEQSLEECAVNSNYKLSVFEYTDNKFIELLK